MLRNLLIKVNFHDGRFHGSNDWPPSPARLFQALVAGEGVGGPISDMKKATYQWLESLVAPIILAPIAKKGSKVTFFVPRNDFDFVKGDFNKVNEIRYPKTITPWLFDAAHPTIYIWEFQDEDVEQAKNVCQFAESLYQLGHGVDMAWATGEIIEPEKVDEILRNYPGQVYRPTARTGSTERWACPCLGTFESLEKRYNTVRFRNENGGQVLRPPSAKFAMIAYNAPPNRCLFELRKVTDNRQFNSIPLYKSANLVIKIRDAAIQKLLSVFPQEENHVKNALNSKVHNSNRGMKDNSQVNIIPLPSIGHRYVDCDIRRILVEVPLNCQLNAEDAFWAFSGLTLAATDMKGELETILTRIRVGGKQNMLAHYGVIDKSKFKIWHTVTPAALPDEAKRRRIDPTRGHEESKSGSERAGEEMQAAVAIFHELRNVRMLPQIESIHVQREPFQSRGMRAEAFSIGTEFAKEQLWHVEIAFKEPVDGPLLIGNGRFLGLGVMAPVRNA